KGFSVAILDCDALRLTDEQACDQIGYLNPRLVCFVLYGQNPNAGTTSMIGAISLASALKEAHPAAKVCFVGSHVSALPRDVLAYPFVDYVLINEGVYALQQLLASNLKDDLSRVRGIGYRDDGKVIITPGDLVPHERMDHDL